MSGPWERYQQAPAASQGASAGPWSRYQAPQAEMSLEDSIMSQPADFGPDGIPSVPFTDSIGPAPADDRSPLRRATDFVVGDDPARALRIGAQGAARGFGADIAGLPVDLTTALMNAGVDVVGLGASAIGEDNPLGYVQNPFMGSDWIADRGADIAEAVGFPVEDPNELSGMDSLGYNINRFSAGAGAGSVGLASRANRVAAPTRPAETGIERGLDALTAPYRGRGQQRTVLGDVGGGAGAGAGLTAAQSADIENPYGQAALEAGAMLGGGLAGAVTTTGATRAYDVGRLSEVMAPDPNIPFQPGTQTPTSVRVADKAANLVQGQATDPGVASQVLNRRLEAARAGGDPMPTTGIGSDDLGLIGLERQLRGDPALSSRFAASDEALQRGASERVGSLRDPDADQGAALQAARERPREIRDQRDVNTRPLLDEAEASGAVVNPAPVVARIDEMLGEIKRPAVRKALTDARSLFNRANSDELDTSVSGLYETRKAINDLIEGRTETSTGQFARSELREIRDMLDEQINAVEPRLGQYIENFRSESRALDVFSDSRAVARMVGNETDMRNTARRLLSGNEYGTEEAMRQVGEVFRDNPEGLRGWKAAVSDVLNDRVTKASGGDLKISELNRVYRQHRDALAEIYTPQEMAALDRANELLEPLGNLSRGVRGGTTSVPGTEIYARMEGALLASGQNAVTTGMIVKRVKTAARLMGLENLTDEYKVAQVVQMMQFNPELAIHLLERPVSEGVSAAWNQRLQNIMAGSQAARTSGDRSEDDPSLEDMIME